MGGQKKCWDIGLKIISNQLFTNLKTVVFESFWPLTAPDVQLPLQSFARSPVKRESYGTESFMSSFINLGIKFKIKKLYFLEFFHFNFLYNLKTFVAVSFLTPHDSRNLTTVKFLESVIC